MKKHKAMQKRRPASTVQKMNFTALVDAIHNIHDQFSRYAAKAVNVSLTVRNWLIGCYIREYEQQGTDRAEYGDNLLERLSKRLQEEGLERADTRELRRYRQFYISYPQIRESVTPELEHIPNRNTAVIRGTVSPEFNSLFPPLIRESATPKLRVGGKRLLQNLSFTHFVELLEIEEPLKRTFYEVECIKGCWSVRELRRQIDSLYFERCGLSKNKKALSRMTRAKAETDSPNLVIRDPYVFEFLGLKPKEVMHESQLEDALLDKVQDFLLELGRGFCFEARQKRILIGDEYFFVDLVFYHRILRCHILLELKLDRFKHEYLGQLNTYVSWFREHERIKDDNPPIGILLCTKKNHALVQYALAGMNSRLFASKYQLKLPSEKELRAFVEQAMKQNE